MVSIGEGPRCKTPEDISENSKNVNISVLDSSPDNFANGSLMDSEASKSRNNMDVKVKTVGRKGQ